MSETGAQHVDAAPSTRRAHADGRPEPPTRAQLRCRLDILVDFHARARATYCAMIECNGLIMLQPPTAKQAVISFRAGHHTWCRKRVDINHGIASEIEDTFTDPLTKHIAIPFHSIDFTTGEYLVTQDPPPWSCFTIQWNCLLCRVNNLRDDSASRFYTHRFDRAYSRSLYRVSSFLLSEAGVFLLQNSARIHLCIVQVSKPQAFLASCHGGITHTLPSLWCASSRGTVQPIPIS